MSLKRVALVLSIVAFVALLIANYLLVRDCGDTTGELSVYLELAAAPILALAIVGLVKFRPTWLWVMLLLVSPFVGLTLAVSFGLKGEFDGMCGRF